MDKELYVVVLSNNGIFKKKFKLNFIRKMTISKLTNIFMYNSDLQCMNANNNISINILVTSEANWKCGGERLDLIRNLVKPKKIWACLCITLQRKDFLLGDAKAPFTTPPPPPVLTPVHLNIHCIYLIQDFLVIKHGRKNLYMLSLYMLTLSWACQMSSLQTGSDLEYNSST